jgi:hypothetical protein
MDEIIERHFQETVSFITSSSRSSSSLGGGGGDLPLLTNAIKLRLYGYYKCATTATAAADIVGNDYTNTKKWREAL